MYPLIDRVTYYAPFIVYIAGEYVDHVIIGSLFTLWLVFASQKLKVQYAAIGSFGVLFAAAAATNYGPALEGIALASLPAIVALLIYNRYSGRKILNRLSAELALNHLAIVGTVIGLMGLGLALVPVLFPEPLPEPPLRNLAYDVYVVMSSFSPVLILLLITCVPVKLLSDYTLRTLKLRQNLDEPPTKSVSKRHKIIYLSFIMLLSVVIALIPHLSTVNPDGQQIGVDTGFYVTWVTNLANSENSSDFFYQAFVEQNRGDRPVSLIFLYSIHQLVGGLLFDVIEGVPLILGPALVLMIYFLVREITSDDITAILAGFLTATSFHTLIGIYAGFYANWLALIFGYLSFLFLFRFMKQCGRVNLIAFGGLLILTLFTHVYTWSILAIVMGIFLNVMLFKKLPLYHNAKRSAGILLVVLLVTVVVDVGRAGLTGSSAGIERDLEVAESYVGPEQFVLRWNNLTYTTTTNVGGQLASFAILGLGLYWLFFRSSTATPSGIFLLVFLSIGILPFLFGNYTIQIRTFYDIPFQIPAAIALAYIASKSSGSRLVKSLPIYIWLVVAAIIAVTNFYLVQPVESNNIP